MRLGGDEFCIVLLNCSKEIMKKKFEHVYEVFCKEEDNDYPKSFSYGITELHKNKQLFRLHVQAV